MDDESATHEVILHVYDLTKGMARSLAPALLGIQLEGVWHSGVVIFGKEYFYGGGGGVCVMKAGQTPYGEPTKKMPLGHTAVPLSVFEEFLSALSTSQFKPTSYNLLKNNCNHFSNEVSNFLCGVDIPKDILDLPEQVLNTPIGAALRPMLEMADVASPEFARYSFNGQSSTPSSTPSSFGESGRPAATPNLDTKTPTINNTSNQSARSGSPPSQAPDAPLKSRQPSADSAVKAARELVAREFESLMATGQYTANAAAAEAVRRVRNRAA